MLKTRENVAATTQNKVEIMFKIHFSFSSIVFMNNIEKFIYSLSTDDEETMTRRKIIKIVYKINSNKILKINEIINKTLQQLARVIFKQICFFLTNTLKKAFNHRILRKSLL